MNIFVSEQTQILLQRMRDKPEDFFQDRPAFRNDLSSWANIALYGEFNFIERSLIRYGLRKVRRLETKNAILEKLIAPNHEVVGEYTFNTKPYISAINDINDISGITTNGNIAPGHINIYK